MSKKSANDTDCYEDNYDSEEDEDRTVNDKSEQDLLTTLDEKDERDIENFESSKMKMALMQKQLQHLTALVQNALVNRDLSQLAVATTHLNLKSNENGCGGGGGEISQVTTTTTQMTHRNGYGNGANGACGALKVFKVPKVKLTNNNGSENNYEQSIELSSLNEKTRSLKSDLRSLKKMQENFSSTFGDSMKSFVSQLNVNIFF